MSEKRKVMLIAPWHDEGDSKGVPIHLNRARYRPPVGLLNIAGILLREGFDVDIIDTRVMHNFRDKIRILLDKNNYLFIGITVSLGISAALKKAYEIQEYCRSISASIPFVWGGFFPSCIPDAILRKYRPDFIVRFDGEETVNELAGLLQSGAEDYPIAGISYIKEGAIIHNEPRIPKLSLNDYPLPAWYLLKDYVNKEQIPYYASVISSLGCPYDCSFCYYRSYDSEFNARRWRSKYAVYLLKEIDEINRLSGITVFTFEDDNFLVDPKRAIDIFIGMKERGFYAEKIIANINNFTDEIMDAMDGVVNEVVFSIESASKRLEHILNKKINTEKTEEIVGKLFKKGINTTVGFMFGLPLEEDRDRKESIEFMKRLKTINPFIRASTTIFKPLPKTPILNFIESNYKIPSFVTDEYCENYDWSMDSSFIKETSPYFIAKNEQYFIVRFTQLFKTIFSPSNSPYKREVRNEIEGSNRLRQLFGDINSYCWTASDFKPYLLDRILSGNSIDLSRDLQREARRLVADSPCSNH